MYVCRTSILVLTHWRSLYLGVPMFRGLDKRVALDKNEGGRARAAAGGGGDDGGENTGYFLKPESSSFLSISPPRALRWHSRGWVPCALCSALPLTRGWGVSARAPEAPRRTAAPPLARWLALPPPRRHRDSAKPSERARAAQRAPGGSESRSRKAGTRGARRAPRRQRLGCQKVSSAHGRPVGVGQEGLGLQEEAGLHTGRSPPPALTRAVALGEDGPSSVIAGASPGWRACLSAAARRAWGAASRAAAAAAEDARGEPR